MIIIAITLLLFVLLAGNYAIYRMFVYAFDWVNYPGLVYIKTLFIVLALSFIVITFITSKSYSPIGKIFYTGSAIWIGTLHWLFLATIVFGIIYIIVSFISPGTNITIIAKVLILVSFGISIYGVWHSYQIKTKETVVALDNLPDLWNGKKIVLFSDTHFGNIRSVGFAKKLVSKINTEEPDMVLVAGDFFDGSPMEINKITNVFKDIKSTYGVYFAPGNHEEYGNKEKFIESLSNANIHVLNNQKDIVDGLQVVGINYSSTKGPNNQEQVLRSLDIDSGVASILIKHEPANIDIAEKFSIGLQVSGHTHKGQAFPLNYLTKSVYRKFFYGLSRQGGTQVYTTSGVGTWGPPQRVGTDSEIVIIKLIKS